MELIASSFDAKKVSLTKSFMGNKDIIKVGKQKFKLPSDIDKSKITFEQNEMTGGRMFLIILLAITVIGLILAIPLYFMGKKKRVTMSFKTKTGETFTVLATNNSESKIIQKYSGIGVFD
jgi:hypothetical protein